MIKKILTKLSIWLIGGNPTTMSDVEYLTFMDMVSEKLLEGKVVVLLINGKPYRMYKNGSWGKIRFEEHEEANGRTR